MVLFICFAVLAAAVTWAVTRPLLAPPVAAPDTERAVYRDQLAEIERERAEGLVSDPDAEAARVEVARRLIRSADRSASPGTSDEAGAVGRYRAVLWAAAALPVAALALYLAVGTPGLPGRPYASRLDAPIEQASAGDLVAKVEAHLRSHPDDGRGWDVLAPVYMRLGEFREAADAYERAIRLLGESPQRLAGFARASIMLANGVVEEPARRAYEKLSALDAQAIEPQVWLAIAREQDGDVDGAADEYRRLAARAGTQEPWKSLIEERLKSAEKKLAQPAEPPASMEAGKVAPPPAGAGAKFHAMTPEQRQAFIESMVAGLAERLKSNGKDLDGWMQLMRAYVVLGRATDASAALASARASFAGDDKALAQLEALAQVLGIGS